MQGYEKYLKSSILDVSKIPLSYRASKHRLTVLSCTEPVSTAHFCKNNSRAELSGTAPRVLLTSTAVCCPYTLSATTGFLTEAPKHNSSTNWTPSTLSAAAPAIVQSWPVKSHKGTSSPSDLEWIQRNQCLERCSVTEIFFFFCLPSLDLFSLEKKPSFFPLLS